MEKRKIKSERSLYVVKKNDIVQKARYKLDLVQQKTIMYLISKINSKKDVEFQDITVDLKDLCEIMGIQYNGKNLKDFQISIQKLADKSMWVDTGSQLILMRWLQRVMIEKGSTSVTVKFDELMAPYLLKIQECFVEYRLENVLPMKSQYSLRMYELLKSHNGQEKWEVTLEELKAQLFIENAPAYDRYDLFRQRVIDPAILEICNYTELLAAYEPKRKDRKIVSLTFYTCECRESRREYVRREINRATVLDNLPTEIVPPRKMPTAKEIQEERNKQKKAAELRMLENKYNQAKKPIDYTEEVSFMPSQTTIEDLF